MGTTEKSGLKRLVIVESPAKARTIEGYLGKGYKVASSIGHIRDLPNRASDVPKEKRPTVEQVANIALAKEAVEAAGGPVTIGECKL